MTPEEQQLLQGLADRVNRTTLTDKDPGAEQFLNQSLGRNPDAVYILAQTVLVQQYALDQAKKQLADLRQQSQQQLAPPQKHTSFLGSLLGMDDRPAAAPPPPPQPQYTPVNAPSYPPPGSSQNAPAYGQPQYGQIQYGTPGYGSGIFGSPASSLGGGSFLGGAMQTAAGVAAGALAFEGIEDLMHGFGHHAGYGSGFDGSFGGGQPREEIVNNYYGDSGGSGEHGRDDFADRLQQNDGFGNTPSSDIEDRRDDGRSFADSGTNTDDLSASDDSNAFDSSADSGGFDDSGSDSADFGSGDDNSF